MESPKIISPDQRFQEVCAHLRATDDISFKLLALVPLVSTAGIATVFLKAEPRLTTLVYFVSAFAATVTVALFCWKRRNIKICKWLRDHATALEQHAINCETTSGHFVGFPRAVIGKTGAEKAVYTSTIIAWLALPYFVNTSVAVEMQVVLNV